MQSKCQHCMEVIDQLHGPSDLFQRKTPLFIIQCSAWGGERENTPLTGAYASNPAVTAFRVSSRVVAASESEDPTYSSGTGKLKDK